MSKLPKIALIGNPNAGKSSLFNSLTGLNQKTGNFPGVTMDKHTGIWELEPNSKVEVLDLPGIYSIYPKSIDEELVINILGNMLDKKTAPDICGSLKDWFVENNLFINEADLIEI